MAALADTTAAADMVAAQEIETAKDAESVEAKEDMMKTKGPHTPTSCRGLKTSTIAIRADTIATIQEISAHIQMEGTICPTSNVMRHTYMPTKVRAWSLSTSCWQTAKDAAWDG